MCSVGYPGEMASYGLCRVLSRELLALMESRYVTIRMIRKELTQWVFFTVFFIEGYTTKHRLEEILSFDLCFSSSSRTEL